MIAELFPLMILFGLCYITFAWALYMRLGRAKNWIGSWMRNWTGLLVMYVKDLKVAS
jgi:hypothetical protein